MRCGGLSVFWGSMLSDLGNLENEQDGEPPTSALPFAVGFYFAFRLFIVLLSVRILGTDPQTGSGINLAVNIFLLMVVAFCCLGEAGVSFRQMAQLSGVRWALFFLGFSCCSLLWSDTASLSVSIAYWCGLSADVAIVILLFRAGRITGTADSLMKGYVWGACVGAVTAWLLPAQSDLRLGDEELLGPNNIGYLCAFAFFFAQYLIRKKNGKWRVPAFLLAVTVLRSLSKTTIVAFLAAEMFLLIRDKSMKRQTKILLVLAGTIVIAAFSALLASYYDIYTSAGNQSETLSGRLGIWAYFLAEALQQPWVGHGFDAVWKVVPPFGPDHFEAPHAHNELLQQFYAYGLVGICIFVGLYGSLYRHIRRLTKGPAKTFFFAFLFFVLVRGTADTDRFDLSFPLWAIVMISLLIEHARTEGESTAAFSPIERSGMAALPQTRSMIHGGLSEGGS